MCAIGHKKSEYGLYLGHISLVCASHTLDHFAKYACSAHRRDLAKVQPIDGWEHSTFGHFGCRLGMKNGQKLLRMAPDDKKLEEDPSLFVIMQLILEGQGPIVSATS